MNYYFLHIPKTGGISFKQVLFRQFNPKRIIGNYDNDKLSKIVKKTKAKDFDLCIGHFPFGIHENFKGEEYQYLTLLRDPVERLLSLYNHIQTDKQHYLWKHEKKDVLESFESFIKSKITIETDNHQVRLLSGFVNVNYGHCNKGMLNKAIENVEKYFCFIGFTEYFYESLLVLEKTLPTKRHLHSEYLNKSINKQNKALISDDLMKTIEEQNTFDIELYNYFLDKFIRAKQQIPDLNKKIENIRKGDLVYSTYKRIKRKIKQKLTN